MRQKYIAILVLVIILLLGSFFLLRALKTSQKTIQTSKHPSALPKEVTITLNKDGFSPKEVTIAVGSAVRWKNISGDKQTVNSDNYPTNQLHKELNFGIFDDGSSVVYIFTKPGTYGYHNQLHPEQKGEVIVEK